MDGGRRRGADEARVTETVVKCFQQGEGRKNIEWSERVVNEREIIEDRAGAIFAAPAQQSSERRSASY
nr:hypothetical protein CFP56_16842 [Quercus suber]